MPVLIDECIDERFRNSLPGHDCQIARYAGLAGLKNGDLLTAAETGNIAIVIFCTKSNRLKYLLPHVPVCLVQIESIQSGQIVRIER